MMAAQDLMETDTLIALMCVAAMVGYFLDRLLLHLNKAIASWKFEQ